MSGSRLAHLRPGNIQKIEPDPRIKELLSLLRSESRLAVRRQKVIEELAQVLACPTIVWQEGSNG